jgi:N6-adenosine-specific RNA methylase IME4
MALGELCKLAVGNIAFDDALLFLWVPPPKLEEAMQVIRAWGFVYRTGAIWVKPHSAPAITFASSMSICW